jgi:hypothetical protein
MKNADKTVMPVPNLHDDENFNGLTKREHFAAMAMQGFLSNPWQAKTLDELGESSRQQMQTVAQASLAMADALLAELEK